MVRTGTMLGTAGAIAGVMPFPLIAAETWPAQTAPVLSEAAFRLRALQ